MGPPEPTRPLSAELPVPVESSRALLWVRLGCLLAWFGACVCFLLLQGSSGLHSYFCPVRGGCETVLGSPYSTVGGVSLSWFGATFYLVLLGPWLVVSGTVSQRLRLRLLDALLWLTLAGLTFSLGLMYVQFGVLHAFCPLCTTSAVTMLALVAVTVRAGRTMASAPARGFRADAWTLALFALFPLMIFTADSMLEPKPSASIELVDLSTAHRRGAANAPVQIVVYSDFQCSFCRQLAAILHQVTAEFPQQVSIVFRYFPLQGHPRAFPAAVAAECAGEQGAFWRFHDKLFADGGDLSDAKLLEAAASLGLDAQRFTACLQSAAPKQVVSANLQEATELGLPGTPSVFINGRQFGKPLTHENIVRRIKELLPMPNHGAGEKR